MGSSPSGIEFVLLSDNLPFDTFNTMRARCFKQSDEERLLTIVEAAAGGLHGFNGCGALLRADAHACASVASQSWPSRRKQDTRLMRSAPLATPPFSLRLNLRVCCLLGRRYIRGVLSAARSRALAQLDNANKPSEPRLPPNQVVVDVEAPAPQDNLGSLVSSGDAVA